MPCIHFKQKLEKLNLLENAIGNEGIRHLASALEENTVSAEEGDLGTSQVQCSVRLDLEHTVPVRESDRRSRSTASHRCPEHQPSEAKLNCP